MGQRRESREHSLLARTAPPTVASSGLAQDMQSIFAATVEAPWCYLEFGQVAWCRSGALVDPRLRRVGERISAAELALAAKGGPGRAALVAGARLIGSARTNGEFFLSLPANSPARNSITEANSLLRAICQSTEATNCTGPAATQAEFRTNIGTWPRVGGLVLISVGVLGVLLLLGLCRTAAPDGRHVQPPAPVARPRSCPGARFWRTRPIRVPALGHSSLGCRPFEASIRVRARRAAGYLWCYRQPAGGRLVDAVAPHVGIRVGHFQPPPLGAWSSGWSRAR